MLSLMEAVVVDWHFMVAYATHHRHEGEMKIYGSLSYVLSLYRIIGSLIQGLIDT